MTRRRVAVVLGLLLAVLAAAFVLRRGGEGPSAEVGAAAPGDGTGNPGSADARPAAVPLAASGRDGRESMETTGDTGALVPTQGAHAGGAAEPTAADEFVVLVEDERGTPIEGARVFSLDGFLPSERRTDAAGRVDVPRAGTGFGVVVDAPGFAPTRGEPEDGAPGASLLRVVLRSGVRVFGTVRWPDGTPVAGAVITVAGDVPPSRTHPPTLEPTVRWPHACDVISISFDQGVVERWFALRRVTTDAAGRFDFRVGSPGPVDCDVVGYEEGGQRRPLESARSRVAARGEELSVELVRHPIPRGSVAGRLVAAPGSGWPVWDASIAVSRRRDGATWWSGFDRTTITDPRVEWNEGAFTIASLVPGAWDVAIRRQGHVPITRSVVVEESTVDLGVLPLDGGARIRGRVVGRDARDTLDVVAVSLETGERCHGGDADPRDPGVFVVEGLTPGSWRVVASSEPCVRDARWLPDVPHAMSLSRVVRVTGPETRLDAPLVLGPTRGLTVDVSPPGDDQAPFEATDVVEVLAPDGAVLHRQPLGGHPWIERWGLPPEDFTLIARTSSGVARREFPAERGTILMVELEPPGKAGGAPEIRVVMER